jgi:DNA segregation ATPase FtsK/SpoIIIE, S-DNA-T family
VARLRVSVERAAALHRRAAATADAAQRSLDRQAPDAVPPQQLAEQHELAESLRAAAATLAPGWLGAPLDATPPTAPLPAAKTNVDTTFVRVGLAQPLDDARFPVIVPLLGQGNLAVDADARDSRVVGLLRSLALRLVAAHPPGELRLRTVDATGTVFGPFQALIPVGLMSAPVTDHAGLRSVLTEAEEWVREPSPRYALLLVIASLPQLTEGPDLARIAALAQSGPAARLHLVVAGWPPPPLTAETTQPPLALTTHIALRNPYAVVGDPPGASFGESLALNSPLYLDPAPPLETVNAVCAQIAAKVDGSATTLAELLPDQPWQESSAEALTAPVGRAGDITLSLRLADLTPHWLVGGRSGSGKTAFLTNVLYGLSSRYAPTELILYLLDFKEGVSFTEFTPTEHDPTWIPQARAVGVESDREYGLAVLQELDAEMTRRSEAYKEAGVTRFAELRKSRPMARIVCVIDEFQVLLQGTDRLAREAVALLESLARKGRSYGIHLILASQTIRGVESLYAKRDSIFGQFPVRVALPGGGDVLDPLNQAANVLGLGQAVVNTAGGLGGPSGASRAHERLVEFPDPHAEPDVLNALRHKLWSLRHSNSPPYVFQGYAPQHLPAKLPRTATPTAYLGRVIDVPLSLAAFPVDASPGRHLAVLGPSELGAGILDAAARSLAAQLEPGTVHFGLSSAVPSVRPVVAALEDALRQRGHKVLADPDEIPDGTYLFTFGADGRPIQRTLRDGPARGVHVFGWWRGLRRFTEDTGGSMAREDVAGLVLLNVPATDATLLIGDASLDWQPRPNRALLHDRHTNRTEVIVPFVHSGQT